MTTPVERYEAKNIRRFTIKVNKKLEPELLSFIEKRGKEVGSIQKYILDKIRSEMKENEDV